MPCLSEVSLGVFCTLLLYFKTQTKKKDFTPHPSKVSGDTELRGRSPEASSLGFAS